MMMVGVASRQWPQGRLIPQVSWLAMRVDSHLAPRLHSSNELGDSFDECRLNLTVAVQ